MVPMEARKGYQIPWRWSIPDGGELLWGCWKSDLGPLDEQGVLLTAEPSFQPMNLQSSNE